MACEIEAEEPPLPQAMGEINDYASMLGRESRQQLQSLIDELKTQKIRVMLLITLLDPYSDPVLFTEKIWQGWNLKDERTALLVLVKEADQWKFHWKFSPDLAADLNSRALEGPYRVIQTRLKERRVAQAALEAVRFLRERWGKPQATEAPSSSMSSAESVRRPIWSSPLLWYSLGGAAGIGVIVGMLWFALMWLCPECGGKLRRDSARGFPYARWARQRRRERVYYCVRCGYLRIRRGER